MLSTQLFYNSAVLKHYRVFRSGLSLKPLYADKYVLTADSLETEAEI